MGRPTLFSDTAIQLCLSVKVLFKLPLRQAVGMVRALLKLAGLDWPVPDYSTLCRRQKTLSVRIPYRRADGPLKLLVDNTGLKFLGDGERHTRKHGPSRRRQWRKVHLAMNTATSDIRAVELPRYKDLSGFDFAANEISEINEINEAKVRFFSTIELVNALEQEKTKGKAGQIAGCSGCQFRSRRGAAGRMSHTARP